MILLLLILRKKPINTIYTLIQSMGYFCGEDLGQMLGSNVSLSHSIIESWLTCAWDMICEKC